MSIFRFSYQLAVVGFEPPDLLITRRTFKYIYNYVHFFQIKAHYKENLRKQSNRIPSWRAIQGTFTTAVVYPIYYGTIYFGF